MRISAGGAARGIAFPRISAIGADRGCRLLARGCSGFDGFRRNSFLESRRELDRPQRRRLDRPVLLLDSSAHGQPLVFGGISRRLGLGRKFSLLGSRQRRKSAWPPALFIVSWLTLAHRRLGRPGRKRASIPVHSLVWVAVDTGYRQGQKT